MLKKKIHAYMSHPIRGFVGKAATLEIINLNNAKAIDWGKKLWAFFGCNLDLYIPAEHDRFVLIALRKGFLSVDQVLEVDCEIVRKQGVLLVANWENHISNGMAREINAALLHHIPTRVFTDVQEDDLRALEMWLEHYDD